MTLLIEAHCVSTRLDLLGCDDRFAIQVSRSLVLANIVIFKASPEYSDDDLKRVKGWYGAIERVNKPFTEDELMSVVDKYLK